MGSVLMMEMGSLTKAGHKSFGLWVVNRPFPWILSKCNLSRRFPSDGLNREFTVTHTSMTDEGVEVEEEKSLALNRKACLWPFLG